MSRFPTVLAGQGFVGHLGQTGVSKVARIKCSQHTVHASGIREIQIIEQT